MKVLNKLIVRQMPWHANMTERNHLGAALIAKPDVFEGKMTQLFTSTRYSDNPLTTMLSPTARGTNSTAWEWELKGASTRPLVVTENLAAGITYPGRGRTTFPLKLDENWYLAGDVIFPGTASKKYQVRIQEVLGKRGNGTVYSVRPMNDDFNFFIPQAYLAAGTPWAKLYSQYEEAGEQSGSTQYSLPMNLANKMGRLRKMYEVTGDAANEVLAVKIPDSKGRMHDAWIKYAEVEYWEQWYREIERSYWYSRSTDTVLGANGRPIYTGPGIQEMLEDSHVHHYSVLSARLIEEYLMDIFYGRVKPGKGRAVKAFTGEYGMIIFHRAIQDWQNKNGFIKNVEMFTNKVSSDLNMNAFATGFQFVRYHMANGASLELIHNPLYDDREINFEIDPITGYPMESMRFTFLDFAEGQKGPNIQIVNKNNGFKLGYVAGLHNPFGPNTTNSLMSHSGDYYEMHVQKQTGMHIEDVTRCGELILTRN